MPRKRASQERREREKRTRALKQAARRAHCPRRFVFRPEDITPVADEASPEQAASRTDLPTIEENGDADFLQIDGREFD